MCLKPVQWTGETFGSTSKTETSEDFKQLQMATETRKEGIENMHASLSEYATSLGTSRAADNMC